MRRLGLALCALLWGAGLASAQITPTYTFGPSTTVTISRLNSNFTNGLADALDRTGGTITGNITVSAGITIDGIDIGATICTTCTPTFASLTLTGGLTAGSGAVAIIGSTGKIPALTTAYFTSVDGSALTGLLIRPNIKNGTAVTGSTTGEDNLQTGSLTAGTLAAAGDTIRIMARLAFAANANNKTANLYFGSTKICTTGSLTSPPNDKQMLFEAWVTHVDATHQIATCKAYVDGEAAEMIGITMTAPGETAANAITIKTTGGDGANYGQDVTSQVLLVEVIK